MEEKNELDALREKLLYKQKQGYDIIDVNERIKLEEYATAYKAYLNAARTEREAVTEAIAQAEALGFVPYERGMVLEPGTKIYKSVRGQGAHARRYGPRNTRPWREHRRGTRRFPAP